MNHISVILVHYNTQDETDDCLKSLDQVKVRGFSYSVLVVDNGSRLQYKAPSGLKRKNVRVIRSESNLGFTGGNNLGITSAIEEFNSDFVLLLNSDTVVEPQFLVRLFEQLQDNPEIGITSPKIFFYPGNEFHTSYSAKSKGSVIWYAGGSVDWVHVAAFHRGVDELDRGQFSTETRSDFATGCCFLIRREILEKIGSFDTEYFLYFEDVDVSMRVRQFGYEIGYNDAAVVWHKNAGSSGGSGSRTQEYYLTRNRLYFASRFGGWKVKIAAIRIALEALVSANSVKRTAVFHALLGRFGKQTVL